MALQISGIADAMIRKPCLPDVALAEKFTPRSKGESTFDQLYGALNGALWRNQQMHMIRHDDEIMQRTLLPVSLEAIQQKHSPALVAKEGLPSRRLKRDEVGLPNSSERFALRPHNSLRG